MGTEQGLTDAAENSLELVHLLRALTVELDLLGGEFARLHGLHPTDLRALIQMLDAVRAGTHLTPGRLGEQLRLNSAGTTAVVDRLERLGHIRRIRDTRDRRRVLLVIEQQAMELGQSFFGPLIDGMVTTLGDFDAAELAAARRFLLAMTRVVAAAREG
ncbi:MarR family transcriptional regulator [Kitasatospora sp. NPDC059648]|uniref:MarR family transcriptional regulator n=1 Tax=Kitasatospora sp. NPDC059648 TaxID=3346894 RepID=UPI0036B4C618